MLQKELGHLSVLSKYLCVAGIALRAEHHHVLCSQLCIGLPHRCGYTILEELRSSHRLVCCYLIEFHIRFVMVGVCLFTDQSSIQSHVDLFEDGMSKIVHGCNHGVCVIGSPSQVIIISRIQL